MKGVEHLAAVVFEHHEMAVAEGALVFQIELIGGDAVPANRVSSSTQFLDMPLLVGFVMSVLAAVLAGIVDLFMQGGFKKDQTARQRVWLVVAVSLVTLTLVVSLSPSGPSKSESASSLAATEAATGTPTTSTIRDLSGVQPRPTSSPKEPDPRRNSEPTKPLPIEKLVNRANFNSLSPAILFRDADGTIEALTHQVAVGLGGTDSLFQPGFATSGRFERARSGDTSAIADLGLSTAASLIVLGERTISFEREEVAGQELVRAEASLSLRLYRPAAAFRSEALTEHIVASGFTKSEALRAADDALAKQAIRTLQELRQ